MIRTPTEWLNSEAYKALAAGGTLAAFIEAVQVDALTSMSIAHWLEDQRVTRAEFYAMGRLEGLEMAARHLAHELLQHPDASGTLLACMALEIRSLIPPKPKETP